MCNSDQFFLSSQEHQEEAGRAGDAEESHGGHALGIDIEVLRVLLPVKVAGTTDEVVGEREGNTELDEGADAGSTEAGHNGGHVSADEGAEANTVDTDSEEGTSDTSGDGGNSSERPGVDEQVGGGRAVELLARVVSREICDLHELGGHGLASRGEHVALGAVSSKAADHGGTAEHLSEVVW